MTTHSVNDHLSIRSENLSKAIVTMHSSPAQVQHQHLTVLKLHKPYRVVDIVVLDKLGVSDVVACSKHAADLFFGVGNTERGVKEPSGAIDVMDTTVNVNTTGSSCVGDEESGWVVLIVGSRLDQVCLA